MKKFKTITLLLASAFALTGCFGGGSDDGGKNNNTKKSYTLGETFRFDDLDLTFGTDYECVVVKDRYSEHYGAKGIALPVTVKNQGQESNTLNPFFFSIYGTKGTTISSLWTVYDDAIENASRLLPGYSYTKNLYFVYDGDGTYKIEFSTFKDKVTLDFTIHYVDPVQEPEPELDKPFVFDNLELTFSSSYTFVVYESSLYSTKTDVVKMPVTVKNVGSTANHLASLDVNVYGPNGNEVNDMCTYYMDDDAVEYGGNLQPGSSYVKSMYFEYTTDGEYKIEFGMLQPEKTLKFNIKKLTK